MPGTESNKERDIILFPSESPFREDCAWLLLRHVKSYLREGTSETHVELSNGSTVILDISLLTFSKKIQRTYELRYKMQIQSWQFEGQVKESDVGYHLMKSDDCVNYVGWGWSGRKFGSLLKV